MPYFKNITFFIYSLLLVIVVFGFSKNITAISSGETINVKNFTIIIPSYNNKNWYKKNLQSVLSQDYSHFRVIYTDDCSPDETGDFVEAYLAENDHNHKVCLVKNSTRRGALHNIYTMVHMSDDDDIIVTLDGDDWFPDNKVLTRLNDIYSSGEIWLTYGQFQLYSSGKRGWASPMPDHIIKNNAFREFEYFPTHLRTYYSWLFKQIKLEDLLYEGSFYSMTGDMATMFPMIEMAGERHKFVPEIMYIYNDENSINDERINRPLQAYLDQVVRKKDRYERLTEKPCNRINNNSIFSDVINSTMMNAKVFSNFYEGVSVLVTGGCGFIGSHLVEKLVRLGADVTILDDLSTGSIENIAAVIDKVTFIQGSIIDFELCKRATQNKKIIFHLAAFVSVSASTEDPYACHNINVTGTQNMLEAARLNNVKRFVNSSTCAIYGQSRLPWDENTQAAPISPYGFSKLMGEIYCKEYAQVFDMETVSMRYFNVYGPRQDPHSYYAGVIAKFMHNMEHDLPITIFGDGTQTRDYVPVHMIVEANILLGVCEKECIQREIFNIATGKSITLLELVNSLKKKYSHYKNETIFMPSRSGDIKHVSANCSKYRSLYHDFQLNNNKKGSL